MNKRFACLTMSTIPGGQFVARFSVLMSSRAGVGEVEQENISWYASTLDELVDKIVASSGQILVILSEHDFWIPIPIGMWGQYATPWARAETIVLDGKHHEVLPALFDEYSNQMLDSIFRFVDDVKHYGQIRG